MSSSKENCDTLLICGNVTQHTSEFHKGTKVENVYEYVQQSFAGSLPAPFRILYYDSMTKSLVNLEDQLRNRSNPFQIRSMDGVQSMASTTCRIHLLVVSDTETQSETDGDRNVYSASNPPIDNENSVSTNEDLSNTYDQSSSPISETTNLLKERLTFLLDVKPTQRDIYKSDQFSVRKSEPNGRIARIQGRKEEHQKMLQVLPKLQIPSCYLQSSARLSVAVVSEKLESGMRIWYKHPDKGFLPERYEKDTQPINPIIFPLDQNNVTKKGEFILRLQMITKWNKCQRDQTEVYRYDDEKTRQLHPAEHESRSPRLLCVLEVNGENDWNTFCLSDFIRTPKPSKHRSSSVTTERTPSLERKRLKTKD